MRFIPKKVFFILAISLFITASYLQASFAPMPHTILGIYDSTELDQKTPSDSLLHQCLAMPLNHLGLRIRYHDINKGLPSPILMEEVQGIITWFQDEKMKDPEAYLKWLLLQLDMKKKLVLLERVGARWDIETNTPASFDLYKKIYHQLGFEYMGQETHNPFVIWFSHYEEAYLGYEKEPEPAGYLKVTSLSDANKILLELERSDLPQSKSVGIGVTPQGGMVQPGYLMYQLGGKKRWILNPFEFFSEVFELRNRPKLDTTTFFGNRILYSFVSTKGHYRLTQGKERKLASDVFVDRLLESVPFPFSVTLDYADLSLQQELEKRAREDLSFETLRQTASYVAQSRTRYDSLMSSITTIDPRIKQSEHQYWIYLSLASQKAYQEKIFNITFDYQKVWETIEKTEAVRTFQGMEQTVIPIGLNFSHQDMANFLSMRSIEEIYLQLEEQPVSPLLFSEYVQCIKGFLNGRINQKAKNTWTVQDYGSCRTVRFDELPETLLPDLEQSEGVIGYVKKRETLYIHLEKQEEATIVLTEEKQNIPYLKNASADVWNVKEVERRFSFMTRAYRQNHYTFEKLLPNKGYQIELFDQEEQSLKKWIVKTNPLGELVFQIDGTGIFQVKMKVHQ